jgi:hypothetical protein
VTYCSCMWVPGKVMSSHSWMNRAFIMNIDEALVAQK